MESKPGLSASMLTCCARACACYSLIDKQYSTKRGSYQAEDEIFMEEGADEHHGKYMTGRPLSWLDCSKHPSGSVRTGGMFGAMVLVCSEFDFIQQLGQLFAGPLDLGAVLTVQHPLKFHEAPVNGRAVVGGGLLVKPFPPQDL